MNLALILENVNLVLHKLVQIDMKVSLMKKKDAFVLIAGMMMEQVLIVKNVVINVKLVKKLLLIVISALMIHKEN